MYKSLPSERLLLPLVIRQGSRQTPSLLPRHILGKYHGMADIPSRAFKHGGFFHAKTDLENYFNLHFPLPQTQSWKYYRVLKKLSLCVIYFLRCKPLLMASLQKMPKLGKSIGKTGHSTAHSTTYCPTLTIPPPANAESSSLHLYQESGLGITVSEIRSELNPYRMYSRPSPRPTNWLVNIVLFNKWR